MMLSEILCRPCILNKVQKSLSLSEEWHNSVTDLTKRREAELIRSKRMMGKSEIKTFVFRCSEHSCE